MYSSSSFCASSRERSADSMFSRTAARRSSIAFAIGPKTFLRRSRKDRKKMTSVQIIRPGAGVTSSASAIRGNRGMCAAPTLYAMKKATNDIRRA